MNPCNFVPTKGKNKGVECGHMCKAGQCKRHHYGAIMKRKKYNQNHHEYFVNYRRKKKQLHMANQICEKSKKE